MATPLRIAVLAGGNSAEAEVSRSSAGGIAAGLRTWGHEVDVIELDRELVSALRAFAPDLVFPVLHGPPGEDGTVQGLLAMLGLPFVGSGVQGSAAAMDKYVAKALFRAEGLPVADDVLIAPGISAEQAADTVFGELGDRVVIKPRRQGSALGVTLLPDGGDLVAPLREALEYGGGALVERFETGREATVAVLDEPGREAIALPVIEITVAKGEWYDYDNRYTPGKSQHIVPADFPSACLEQLADAALRAHRCLGLRDLSRADFVVADDDIYLLEVNTLPGMTATSLYPDACRTVGIDFAELAERLALSALRRGPERTER